MSESLLSSSNESISTTGGADPLSDASLKTHAGHSGWKLNGESTADSLNFDVLVGIDIRKVIHSML